MARSKDLAEVAGLGIVSATIEARFRDCQRKAGMIASLTLFGPTAPLDPVFGDPPIVATIKEVARLYRVSSAAGDYDRSAKLLDMLLKNLAAWETTMNTQMGMAVKMLVERAKADAVEARVTGSGALSEADLLKVIDGGDATRRAAIREAAAATEDVED
jgi:hypothetical protein